MPHKKEGLEERREKGDAVGDDGSKERKVNYNHIGSRAWRSVMCSCQC